MALLCSAVQSLRVGVIGCGQIGSAVTRGLLKANHAVAVSDKYSTKNVSEIGRGGVCMGMCGV